ncbi:hypothetical protein MWF98_04940 [Fusobacterium necrophorum]|uniref:hypothetical protein n=1 Tax=Fusobacterium TaxID=848 RepID=UPI0001BC65D6|nr:MULTISPECIES: hypothetical protein [Fusobacterium]AVQ16324.1 hypothetical protein C4N16_01725 [Fusobacterium gonidiaformans ATCC 25563]EFS28894.1 hypothetical protein FGAG_01215 [Fusobacterium gonidiaformans ATCC 25563]MDK4474584.1 hypothetical protein [Fusobacterium necrophorum]MDK4496058.1 hypothetical protein [Fusobacterium necrophorum]MDK4503559.1 hypothetical protein [Fusobacterium necrophorum]
MKTRYKLYDTKNKILLGIYDSLSEVRSTIKNITGRKIRLEYNYNNQGTYSKQYLTFVERYI